MHFTRYILAIGTFAPLILAAPTLIQRQDADDVLAQPPSSETGNTLTVPAQTQTQTAELEAEQSETPTPTASLSSASASQSGSASASASASSTSKPKNEIHFTNEFPDEFKVGDKLDLEWTGGDGWYQLFTITNYPGLSNIRPNNLARNTTSTSYSLELTDDYYHDDAKLTIGIAYTTDSKYGFERVTKPFKK